MSSGELIGWYKPRSSGKLGTGSLVSNEAAVVVLLSLRRLATGPELAFRRLEFPDAVRPSLLSARLPDDILRVRPFCLGVEDMEVPIEFGPVEVGVEVKASGRAKGSTYDEEKNWVCDCDCD